MSHISLEAGRGRESLYTSLSSSGHPEWETVLKVVSALGLQRHVSTSDSAKRAVYPTP
jgi:probable addiction module antidote protein